MSTLEDRLLDCFPSGNYALLALLRITDIVETDRIRTAAVSCEAQPKLLINPEFVRNHADTPEKLLMLVMHELHHILLGHTTLFPTVTPVQNFIFDCVINALISRMFPSTSHTAFLTDIYSDERFPECFLRPPKHWNGTQPVDPPKGIDGCAADKRKTFKELYVSLYSPTGVSYDDLYRLIEVELRAYVGDIMLIGGHEGDAIDSAKPDLASNSPEMFDVVRHIVEKWPQPPDPIKGRSFESLMNEGRVHPAARLSKRSALRKLLKWLGSGGSSSRIRAWRHASEMSYSAVPGFARRDLVLRSLGQNPLLYVQSLDIRRRVPSGDKVHVYVDVSGSMDSVMDAVYGAVRDCGEWVHRQVHLFSNQVNDVKYEEFIEGKRKTTYGTDIGCVAKHIAENGVKRACIVTDGWVGEPQGRDRETLFNVSLGIAYVGEHQAADLAAVADRSVEINV